MRRLQLYVPCFVLAASRVALACPLCHTERGDEVRAAIFNTEFWPNLGTAVLPFMIFAGVVAAIYRGEGD